MASFGRYLVPCHSSIFGFGRSGSRQDFRPITQKTSALISAISLFNPKAAKRRQDRFLSPLRGDDVRLNGVRVRTRVSIPDGQTATKSGVGWSRFRGARIALPIQLKTYAFLDFESDLMPTKTKVRWQDRVDRPYQKVQELLTQNANEVFHRATSTAKSRMETEAADLHTKIGRHEFRKDVTVKVQSCTEIESDSSRKLVIDLEWKATESELMFPTMFAQLHVSPVKGVFTQLDFRGEYEPPMGLLGKAIDMAMGQRIAEDCVRHFVEEVTDYLHKSLTRDD